tara:strand:- start:263 stop:553 length:291 start_codon:yes stop_codon:yes gene_type:complete
MDFMMNAKEDIICHYGEIFVLCSTIYPFPQLLMREYCVCMEAFLQIYSIFLKLMRFQDQKMYQMKVFYVIYYGQILMIYKAGEKMKEEYLLFSVKI